MVGLTEWVGRVQFSDRPWLVLGKGPSFSRRGEFDLSAYNLLSLNHVVREAKVHIAHVIDMDVVRDCADSLLTNCDWLVMPYRPHVNFRPGPSLAELVGTDPVLAEMDRRGRLVWYNLVPGGFKPGDRPLEPGSPPIEVNSFSSVAAVQLLAELGARTVRTLGVDGGKKYSQSFEDLAARTRLANGQPSFDLQFAEIDAVARDRGVDVAPLVAPMRVFVGVDDSQRVAAKVLHHSILKHTTGQVEFHLMDGAGMPIPKDPANKPRTGFSFCRFMIPKLCGYQGRALYLDADMQVFADLAELWQIPFGERKVLCTFQKAAPGQWADNPWFHLGRQMSVMLLDCGRLDWDTERIVRDMDDGKFDYKQLMFDLCLVKPEEIADDIPAEWNCLEHREPTTKLLHYTVVPTQPWKNDENPLRSIWEAEFREAVADGMVTIEEVRKGVEAGHLKPGLLDLVMPDRPTPADAAWVVDAHYAKFTRGCAERKYWAARKHFWQYLRARRRLGQLPLLVMPWMGVRLLLPWLGSPTGRSTPVAGVPS
jgi:hypothetical protein